MSEKLWKISFVTWIIQFIEWFVKDYQLENREENCVCMGTSFFFCRWRNSIIIAIFPRELSHSFDVPSVHPIYLNLNRTSLISTFRYDPQKHSLLLADALLFFHFTNTKKTWEKTFIFSLSIRSPAVIQLAGIRRKLQPRADHCGGARRAYECLFFRHKLKNKENSNGVV